MSPIVLAPLDGSAFAEQALPLAVAVARMNGARLQLVRVQPAYPLSGESDAARYLAKLAADLEPQLPGQVDHQLLVNDFGPLEYAPPASNAVADVIQRHAADAEPLLMVLATHGFGGVRRAWLGSVADSLIRIASCPVLLVRPQDEPLAITDHGICHVLVPLDGSEAADRAIPFALQLGMPFGARYTVLRAVSPLTFDVAPRYDRDSSASSPLSREVVRRHLDGAAHQIRSTGAICAIDIVDDVSAADAIVDYAREHGVDAIVVATEGAGRVRRLLLGSVTDKVVRSSDLPVLVCNVRTIPADGTQAAPERAHAIAADLSRDMTR
jgi:nucleotide-binding universal stress UspA family protein